ncbi:DMT family transporter [Flagellimonas sp. DF-77]|uniref:DMT family transporter n=1 Tax=Flagellimonas algarum TaxID=3230298 RepID=UPI0033926B81
MEAKRIRAANFIEINLAMLFVSTSGALGRYIELSVPLTIAVRCILAALILGLYCKFKGISLRLRPQHRWAVVFSGLLLGGHWVTYFYALQLSSVAIGMLSLFTYPVITSFLEPIVLKTKFQKAHIGLGILVLAGIYFLNGEVRLGSQTSLAIGIGIFSALLYSLRNLLMKQRVDQYHGSSLMWYQLVVIAFALAPAFMSEDLYRLPSQLPWIAVLALLTTAIGHTMFLGCFRYFSVTTISILSSIQPIYGILIGMLFLKEIPDTMTILGGLLILSAVVIESLRTRS